MIKFKLSQFLDFAMPPLLTMGLLCYQNCYTESGTYISKLLASK